MPKFHVISGNLLVAAPLDKDGNPIGGKKQVSIGFGGDVEMSEADRQQVDPRGERFVPTHAFLELRKAADAHHAFLEKQKALGSAPVSLTPKLLNSFVALAEAEKAAEQAKKTAFTKHDAPKGK